MIIPVVVLGETVINFMQILEANHSILLIMGILQLGDFAPAVRPPHVHPVSCGCSSVHRPAILNNPATAMPVVLPEPVFALSVVPVCFAAGLPSTPHDDRSSFHGHQAPLRLLEAVAARSVIWQASDTHVVLWLTAVALSQK